MLVDLEARNNVMGVSIMTADVAINIADGGFYYDDDYEVKHDIKDRVRQLTDEYISNVKHPITINPIIRRIEFYEEEIPYREHFTSDPNDQPSNFNAMKWSICIDLVRHPEGPGLHHGSASPGVSIYDETRRGMTAYGYVDRNRTSRLKLTLAR